MVLRYKPTDATGNDRSTTTYETIQTHVSNCPDCDSAVVDGQGLLGCVDCDWHRIVA